MIRRFSGLFWPPCSQGDLFCGVHIDKSIWTPQNKSKIGSKEPENRQNLSYERGLIMIPAISFSLHEAISNNHSLGDIQKFIHPVACNIKNQQGESALKLACGNREENVIECVIHGGADITE